MERSRNRVERASRSREPVYGVSTGFGALAGTRVAPLRQPELQIALIRSHAAGVGPPVDVEVVRAMMLLRARTLAMGDRKSTRLNSSHMSISYAVFCLK